jgi:hypothetical protein
VPLHDVWCPACGTTFEAIVSTGATTARCTHCFGDARTGPPGDPPSARARVVAEARRHGTLDAKREAELGHFETSDADTLLDLDWEHAGKKKLEAACAQHQIAWADVEEDLFSAYYDAFQSAAPT